MTLFVQYFSHHWAKDVNNPIIKKSDGRSESYKLASSVTEAVKPKIDPPALSQSKREKCFEI